MDLNSLALQALILLLKYAIPMIGSLIGGPLGWLAGIALNYLSGLLVKLVEQLARLHAVDVLVAPQVAAAKASTAALLAATTPEAKEKALADFKAAHRALGHFDLVR